MLSFFKERRRRKLISQPFPEIWRQILQKRFPLFQRLPESDRQELEGHIQIFLAEKTFEGCGGLTLTDDMRVSVAAQACLLLLGRETECYPELQSILIYPSTYSAKTTEHSQSGIVTESQSHRLGESWQGGAVVLAWDSIAGGAINISDGQNVVLHEFAHQLDQQDGRADGTPLLHSDGSLHERRNRYLAWTKVLGREYVELQGKARKNQKTVMDHYGATHPAEFFAVATECFFEKPRQMNAKHPDLYEELKKFYRQDPLTWPAAERV
ncbi:MAG: zinc-dependent peptidase [Verrucomicrobia bacterium]|nr:zinc-dependent peptidase [Verrucomicrobiota bacterium]